MVYRDFLQGVCVTAIVSKDYKSIYEKIFPSWRFLTDAGPRGQYISNLDPTDLLIDFRSDGKSAKLRENLRTKNIFFFDFEFERKIVHRGEDGACKVYPTIKIKDLAHEIGTEIAAWKMDAELISAALHFLRYRCAKPELPFYRLKMEQTFRSDRRQTTGRLSEIFIFPCGSTSEKRWPTSNWLELIQRVTRRAPLSIHIFLGPAETGEISLFQDLGPSVCIYQSETWASIIPKLNSGVVVLANDCGPMHACAVLGVPVLAIFGPTNPNVWFTYSPPSRYLKASDRAWPEVESVYEWLFSLHDGAAQLRDKTITAAFKSRQTTLQKDDQRISDRT